MANRLVLVSGLASITILLAGCSGSGSSNTLAPTGQPTSADVTTVMQTVVLPMVGGMADLSPEDGSLAAPPPGTTGNCHDISNFCSNEGTAERCTDTPNADIAWSYQQCVRGGRMFNGTVGFTGQLSNGTTTFDIAIGDLTLAGSVGWSQDGLCGERSYAGFSAVRADQSVSIDGLVRFCLFGDREGQLALQVVKADTSFALALDFDAGTGTATVVGPEGSFTCTVDMGNGEADCDES